MASRRQGPHDLQRGLTKLSLGIVRDIGKAEAARAPNRLQEGEQQFQIPISGVAADAPAWVQKEVNFSWTFVNATGQRESWLEEPQITHGVRLVSQTPVVVSCCVMKWDKKDADEIEGATVAIGVHNPGGVLSGVSFKGALHLSFQGFGFLGEAESEDVE